MPQLKLHNQIGFKQENAKNIEIPEFKIKLNNEQEDNRKSKLKLGEITNDSKVNNSIAKSAVNPSPVENIATTRNSTKKLDKINTDSSTNFISKLRSNSVAKLANEEEERPSLSQSKKRRLAKHSSSSLLKEKIESNQNYFLGSVKINANMSSKDIIKLEYDTKESVVKHPLLSDNPVIMKVSEARIVESWGNFDEASEPITPVRLADTINKQKTNTSHVIEYVPKKTPKKSPIKVAKTKHKSVPARVEKIEQANKQPKVKPPKKIQLKENFKIQASQSKVKPSGEGKAPNTIK